MALLFILTVVTLNANGLHDQAKWEPLWWELPKADIIYLQETHLTSQQERAFALHAPSFDFFFAHGTSNSGGVLTAVNRRAGIIPIKAAEIKGWMIAIDVAQGDVQMRIVNVYAPNLLKDRQDFFASCFQNITSSSIVLGDFNLVEENFDHLSGRLDSTSCYLSSLIHSQNLVEPAGSQRFSFTYHHPSLSDRKSRINCIYVNCSLDKLKGYSQYMSVSDHYLVGLYKLPNMDKGPKLWHLPEDALSNEHTCQNVDLILSNFNYNDLLNSWEGTKVKIQNAVQTCNKFCQKQIQQELAGLKSSLHLINKRIFMESN